MNSTMKLLQRTRRELGNHFGPHCPQEVKAAVERAVTKKLSALKGMPDFIGPKVKAQGSDGLESVRVFRSDGMFESKSGTVSLHWPAFLRHYVGGWRYLRVKPSDCWLEPPEILEWVLGLPPKHL